MLRAAASIQVIVTWIPPHVLGPSLAEVSLIRVRVRNGSRGAIQIRYADFQLLDEAGHTYAALPVRPSHVAPAAQEIVAPRFGHVGFYVADYLATSYPELPVWRGPFQHDARLEDSAFELWPAGLPDSEVRSWLLPAGVLEAMGDVRGVLCFSSLPPGTREARLHAALVPVQEGAPVAELQVALMR